MDKETLNAEDAMAFCDSINLTNFNQIQPHGVLLVLDENLLVVQHSENIDAFLGTTGCEIMNKPLTDFLKGSNAEEDVSKWLLESNYQYNKMQWLAHDEMQEILVYINRNTHYTVIEIERSIETVAEDHALFYLTQYVITSMKNTMDCVSIAELAQRTCQEIKSITGYHRVIVYQFDQDDHSGVVIGELGDPGMDTYLGLRFPANDIPQAVREMYLKQPLRYIPTITNPPIKINPELNFITQKPVDLSGLNLRMVAPVHVRYLSNMHVMSATSVAIIQNNKLWGLIACHHKEEKYLSLNLRLVLLLIAQSMATQSLALESTSDFVDERKIVELQGKISETIGKAESLSDAISNDHQAMMDLVGASGMSHYFQDIVLSYGEAPMNDQAVQLLAWLKRENLSGTYYTSQLPMVYATSAAYKDKACGLLAIKVTALSDHYLLFYKPEKIATIAWAGNPSEVLKCSRTSYSPRESFHKFLQDIENQSTVWSKTDIDSASFIRSMVTNKQLQDLLQVQAVHDPLTNLLNRLYLEQRLSLEIQRASRTQSSLGVILVDIDYFKKVNDTYGHQAGDEVLVEFSKLLNRMFRGYDYRYRYGGEEFLILLPGVEPEGVEQKAEALRDETKKLKIQYNQLILPAISVSIGISMYPDQGVDARSLIAAADVALYQAKQNGRDQVAVALAR